MIRAGHGESGFTLVELLVVIVIGTIVMGGAATALIASSSNYMASATRLVQSHDAQLLSSWVVPDIISAGPNVGDIDTTSATNTTGCSGGVVVGSTNVLKLSWSDFVTAEPFAASYRLEGLMLVRYFCTNGSAPSRTVIGHNVQTAVAKLVGQEINVAVTALVNGSAYSFSVSASHRTTIPPSPTTTLP